MHSEISRTKTYNNKVIFIDGYWRSGKSLLSPLVGTFNDVDKVKYDYHTEWVCILDFLNLIDSKAASVLLKTFLDLYTYNNYVGREINLRPKDDSSVFQNPKTFKFLRRILKDDKQDINQQIETKKPIQLINTHNVFQMVKPLLQAFGERVYLFRCIRNPVNNLTQWAEYLNMVGKSPKALNIYKAQGEVPWYVPDKLIDTYIGSPSIVKAAISQIELEKLAEKRLQNLESLETRYLTVPFENFVRDPSAWMNKISKILEIPKSKSLPKLYKKYSLPRPKQKKQEYEKTKKTLLALIKNSDIKDKLEINITKYENNFEDF
jgi:hypothetical protein